MRRDSATGVMAIRDAVEDLVDRCRELPNPTRIAAVEGDRIVIDSGQADGVAVGKRFRYLIPGRAVYNAAGQIIGSLDEEGGEIEVTTVQELMSIAKVTRKVSSPVVGGRAEPLD